jgi:hypothetical protein
LSEKKKRRRWTVSVEAQEAIERLLQEKGDEIPAGGFAADAE